MFGVVVVFRCAMWGVVVFRCAMWGVVVCLGVPCLVLWWCLGVPCAVW